MAARSKGTEPASPAQAIPVAEGEDPWTEEEVEEIRQELLADIARMERAIEVAEAVIFMLTRRKGVVVRDLVILPHSVDI